MAIPQFKHSPTEGHLGCFQYLAIMNPGVFIKLILKMSTGGHCVQSLGGSNMFRDPSAMGVRWVLGWACDSALASNFQGSLLVASGKGFLIEGKGPAGR